MSNSPRMWVGFKRLDIQHNLFYQQLGEIFMPATVQVMGQLGLQSYIPTVLPSIEGLADEVALVFYSSPEVYQQACSQSCAGRMYTALHKVLFAFPESKSAFPKDDINIKSWDQANYIRLFDHQPNWQQGHILTEVWQGIELKEEQFKQQITLFIAHAKQHERTELKGVYFYVKAPFLIIWSSWQHNPSSLVYHLSGGNIITSRRAKQITVPSLFESYQGIKVDADQSFNFQFNTI